MKTYIKKIKKFLIFFNRVNWIRTFIINFKTQKFSKAIKLPILIYGRVATFQINGIIDIIEPIKFGLIKIGYRYIDLFPVSLLPTQIIINGTLRLSKNIIIGGGVNITVERINSLLKIGNYCTIGGGTVIKSTNKIIIEDSVQITGECIIMDSEMHFTKNIETDIIKKNFGSIIIKNNCWINQRTTISKDSIIPEFSVTGRNSFLNKDYSGYGTNLLLVGSPAQVKDVKIMRVFSSKFEQKLDNYFRSDLNKPYFYDSESKKLIVELNSLSDSVLFHWSN